MIKFYGCNLYCFLTCQKLLFSELPWNGNCIMNIQDVREKKNYPFFNLMPMTSVVSFQGRMGMSKQLRAATLYPSETCASYKTIVQKHTKIKAKLHHIAHCIKFNSLTSLLFPKVQLTVVSVSSTNHVSYTKNENTNKRVFVPFENTKRINS